MRYFLDIGGHLFEGLNKFVEILNLNENDVVYSYEPNQITYKLAKEGDQIELFEKKFKAFKHFNMAVLDRNGKITFNAHDGAWANENKEGFMHDYRGGSNCLDLNPQFDPDNGVHFKIIQQECDCIDIEDILSSIVSMDPSAEIMIKCDIEGSEFVVLPKLLNSSYVNHVKAIYIEWHERFWKGTCEYENKIEEKIDIINKFVDLNIPNYEWC